MTRARAASMLLGVALTCWGCASTPGHPLKRSDSGTWEARRTDAPPKIDGRVDSAWSRAKPLRVVLREAVGGDAPFTVVLRALYTEDRVYVLAQWPDATRSDMRDPYVWNASRKEYERPTKPDDQFALEFPLSGGFEINMMTTTSYVADVWHWKAGRGNPAGWVDDKRHIIGDRSRQDAKVYEMGGHETVFIARPMDHGRPAYRRVERPTSYVGDRVDSYTPQEPGGSLADVRGKARHDGAGWTLEMSRRFETGHPDDAVLDPARDNICAIAVLNDELYWRHSISGLLRLRFVRD